VLQFLSNETQPVASAAAAREKRNDCPVCQDANCPACQPCDSIQRQSINSVTRTEDDAVFDRSVIGDPQKTVEFMNKLCNAVIKSSPEAEGRKLGIGTVIFCFQHVLTYKRGYGYGWDNVASSDMGYYTGVDLPPYQMDMFQYSVIHAVVASIPAKSIKDDLEQQGSKFSDVPSNYNKWKSQDQMPRGDVGPRVLFWGCGSDTPMHSLLLEFLGGTITFIDNSPSFIEVCKKSHPDIRLIEPSGKNQHHTSLIENLVPSDGSGLDTDDVNDPLTESQWIEDLSGIDHELPWDIIVIDGPAQDLGRSQPLYMAKRLAQSYAPNHYTHIFLHDASRRENCIIANAIMGHDPSVYMGNTLPRKGLKHWRVAGRNRKLPPTNN